MVEVRSYGSGSGRWPPWTASRSRPPRADYRSPRRERRGKNHDARHDRRRTEARRGSVRIDGTDGWASLYGRRQLGALLDHKRLYPRLTARENIRYFGALHGLQDLDERVSRTLALLGLDALADRRAGGFSQGERMKVALGRAVVHGPRNLLLDEPTNGLDISSVRALRGWLKDMRDRGICILFSSHVLEDVRALCDRSSSSRRAASSRTARLTRSAVTRAASRSKTHSYS